MQKESKTESGASNMTTPPKELSLDEAAERYVAGGYGCDDHTSADSFKAGAAYQAGVEEKRAQVLVETLQWLNRRGGLGIDVHDVIDSALSTYKSKGTDHE